MVSLTVAVARQLAPHGEMKSKALAYILIGAVCASGLAQGTDQPQTNVWKTSNTSRPWQNPAWATTTGDNPVTPGRPAPAQNTDLDWPSLPGTRRLHNEHQRQPSSTVSYSSIVNPSSQSLSNPMPSSSHNQRYPTPSSLQKNHNNQRQVNNQNQQRLSSQVRVPQKPRSNVTEQELTALSEKLFEDDKSSFGRHISINYQNRTQSNSLTDVAPAPFLSVSNEVLNKPTIKALRQLYDNYIADQTYVESVTAAERQEENEFLDQILDTTVMTEAMEFLADKGHVQKNRNAYKELLATLWFTMYSRGSGIIGSSAFEHVFLGELNKDEVAGLHNWVYFANEEENRRADYMGYLKKLDLGRKNNLAKIHYRWSNALKYSGTMFVGTSPELEMALYTVCFMTHPDDRCPLMLGGKTFAIQTYKYRLSKNRGTVIGSAYPVF